MTFEQFMDISASNDFVLSDIDIRNRNYRFTDSKGNNIYIEAITEGTPIDDSMINWKVEVNDERVIIDEPSELNTINFIISVICTRTLNLAMNEMKKSR